MDGLMPGFLAFMIGGQALAHAGEGPLKDCGPCPHADDRIWCHMYCLKMARAHDPTMKGTEAALKKEVGGR